MPNDSQSILVITSFLFFVVMFMLIIFKGPRISPFSRARFNRSDMPLFLRFIIVVVIGSTILGFVVSNDISVTGSYVLLNLFIGGVTGSYLTLFRDSQRSDKSTSKDNWTIP